MDENEQQSQPISVEHALDALAKSFPQVLVLGLPAPGKLAEGRLLFHRGSLDSLVGHLRWAEDKLVLQMDLEVVEDAVESEDASQNPVGRNLNDENRGRLGDAGQLSATGAEQSARSNSDTGTKNSDTGSKVLSEDELSGLEAQEPPA